MRMELYAVTLKEVDYYPDHDSWFESLSFDLRNGAPFPSRTVTVNTALEASRQLLTYSEHAAASGLPLKVAGRKLDGRLPRGMKDARWWKDGISVNRMAAMTDRAKRYAFIDEQRQLERYRELILCP